MNPDEVRRIFDAAADLPAGECEPFLREACGDDAELRQEVVTLLHAMHAGSRFMAGAKADAARADADAASGARGAASEEAGAVIGRYTLLKPIGEGGFGTVFLAEQRAPVVRRVALKIIKLGMDTRQVIARFEAERQALAMMDHPGIARVLDAGATEAGRPYFVMELVEGEPITTYCEARGLDTRRRLELFVEVCHAVQHAHTKGVIHRDLKPGNVLVAELDGRAVPKIIDFGIAKAINQRLTEQTVYTEVGQLIGTPEYMSPEQAAGSASRASADIDTRTDIYSLGVVLYELLTGSPPLEPERLRAASWDEMLRMIREEDPPRPSTRLSAMKDTLASVAAQRGIEPARLPGLIRGDLDWIVMRCLEKDRGRRYETANGVAMDLHRHLAGEPVLAAPPNRAYRFRKFVRRNRVATLIAATTMLTISLGLAGTTWGVFWALNEQRRSADAATQARAEAERSSAALALIGEMLQPQRTRDVEDRPLDFVEHLEAFERSLPARVKGQPDLEAEVRTILGRAFRGASEPAGAQRQFARVLALRRVARGELDPSTSAAVAELVRAMTEGGHLKQAIEAAEDSVDRAARAARGDHAELGNRLYRLAQVYEWAGERAQADAIAGRCLAMFERLHGHEHWRVADCQSLLAYIALRQSQHERAEALYGESVALCSRLGLELDPMTTEIVGFHAGVKQEQGDLEGAEQVLRDSIERARHAIDTRAAQGGRGGAGMPSDPTERLHVSYSRTPTPDGNVELVERLHRLALCVLIPPDREDEAIAVLREALALARRHGPEYKVGEVARELGSVLWSLGRFQESDSALREALSIFLAGNDWEATRQAPSTAGALSWAIRDGGGDRAEAESLAREALHETTRASHERFWTVSYWRLEVAAYCWERGANAEAERLERQALPFVQEWGPYLSAGNAHRMTVLGDWLTSLGRHQAAELPFGASVWILERVCPDHWLRFDAASALGACLAAQGRFAEAEPLLLEGRDGIEGISGAPADALDRAAARLQSLYEAWHAAEPGAGYDAKAAEWRTRLHASSGPSEAPAHSLAPPPAGAPGG
jgi:serine/threonine protein kinase/tetratricopeptide (TPR) repeat protein